MLALTTTGGAVSGAESWPDFRGPRGDGHVISADGKPVGLPLEWSETKNIKWKTDLPLLVSCP